LADTDWRWFKVERTQNARRPETDAVIASWLCFHEIATRAKIALWESSQMTRSSKLVNDGVGCDVSEQ
jgi:hypothetical protein